MESVQSVNHGSVLADQTRKAFRQVGWRVFGLSTAELVWLAKYGKCFGELDETVSVSWMETVLSVNHGSGLASWMKLFR
jgi:pyridoxal/pyridoxine/pyridoxamine kinase